MSEKQECPNCGRKRSLLNRQLFTLEGGIIKCARCSTIKERLNSQEMKKSSQEMKKSFNDLKQSGHEFKHDMKEAGHEMKHNMEEGKQKMKEALHEIKTEFKKEFNKPTGGPSMKSPGIAYLLWFIGALGIFGFHRFYIGKFGTGLIWLCTAGVFGVGALIDLFTLGGQVENYNTRVQLQSIRTSTESAARMNAEKA